MLRRLQMREMPEAPEALEANCDLCGTSMPEDHRHLLQLDERSIVCACESCWALRSGDAEYVPTGSRVVWLDDLDLPDDLWARFQIPIGLAFFLRTQGGVVAFYPSPAGATESELDLGVWGELCAKNPVVADLEPEAEALIVDHRSETAASRDRPDRRGLPAGGAREGELAGHLGRLRRGGGPGGLLRRAEVARVSEQRRARARVLGARRRGDPARGGAHALVPDARARELGSRRLHDRAQGADPARGRRSARTARERASACGTCSASPSAGTTPRAGVLWTCRDVLVPSFRGSTKFELQVPCSTDLELATTRYFDAVPDGHAPLAFHFSGSIIYADGPDRMQVARVPWHVTAQYRLPVEVWRAAAGDGGLVRLGGDTFAELARLRDRARRCSRATPRWRICWLRRGRRPREPAAGGAGRLAPLRGLRPLPVHARGHEERHAHAVRHRLPARLRRAQSELLRAAADRVRGRGRRRGVGRGALPPAVGRAARGRGARGSTCASRGSWSSSTRRCAGACGCGPSPATTAAGS